MAIGLEARPELILVGDAEVLRNAPPARLYELAIAHEGAAILSTGALAAFSGEKTGRSPKDKRIIEDPASAGDVWWGPVNIPAGDASFLDCRRSALDFLGAQPTAFVVDGYAGWEPEYRVKVRVICSRAYHALFMHNLLIRPTPEELEHFGQPDFLIINAGDLPADPLIPGVSSRTSVMLHLERREMVILGTTYAGEMKKGVFTAMNYWMPMRERSRCIAAPTRGRGATSASSSGSRAPARPRFRPTRGGGSSAMTSMPGATPASSTSRAAATPSASACASRRSRRSITPSASAPCWKTWSSIPRPGSPTTMIARSPRTPGHATRSSTSRARSSPASPGHPDHIIFLTCDAFGVLPPVSRLTPAQAMYHFLSGYTAKVAGTEVGVVEPQVTFSACFGAAFLVLHPVRYAEMLADRIERHGARAWLVNTGWTGGPHGVGSRIKLAHTRAIIDAIHDGSLQVAPTREDPIFGLHVPTFCRGMPAPMAFPRNTWPDPQAYDLTARRLADQFRDNFEQYADQASEEVRQAGPRTS